MMFSRIWRYALLSAGILAGAAILANESSAAGLLSPSDGTTPPLVIQDQAVRVTVEDGYAITAVEQVFRNPHGKDFEAIYSFPVIPSRCRKRRRCRASLTGSMGSR
jgi:Ca-activated chloride channel family protein